MTYMDPVSVSISRILRAVFPLLIGVSQVPFQPTCAYIGAGARVIFRDPYNLNQCIVMH